MISFKKMNLKMSSAKWQACCLGLNLRTFHIRRDIMSFVLQGYTSSSRCGNMVVTPSIYPWAELTWPTKITWNKKISNQVAPKNNLIIKKFGEYFSLFRLKYMSRTTFIWGSSTELARFPIRQHSSMYYNALGPIFLHITTLIPAWVSYHRPSKVWD